MSSNVFVKSGRVTDILTSQTTTGAGPWQFKDAPEATFQAVVSGTGAVAATVVIEVSNDGVNACSTPMATISLAGTTTASDGFTSSSPWKYIRANVTAVSGTGATVSVNKCV